MLKFIKEFLEKRRRQKEKRKRIAVAEFLKLSAINSILITGLAHINTIKSATAEHAELRLKKSEAVLNAVKRICESIAEINSRHNDTIRRIEEEYSK